MDEDMSDVFSESATSNDSAPAAAEEPAAATPEPENRAPDFSESLLQNMTAGSGDEAAEAPEPVVEEDVDRPIDIIMKILHKNSAIACEAMRTVERATAEGTANELVEAAAELITTIENECPEGTFHWANETPNQLINILLCRCEEDRVNLKKGALLALQTLFLQDPDPECVDAFANKLAAKCRDLAVAIRKQAAQTLTRFLLNAPQFEKLHTTWLHSVMHLIVDREPSVQQTCAKLISEVLIDPILRNNTDGIEWRLLSAIEHQADLKRLMLRCLVFQNAEKNLSPRLVDKLYEKSRVPEYSNACWMLLSELSAFLEVPTLKAVEVWSDRLDLSAPNRLIAYVSKLLANRAKSLSLKNRQFLRAHIQQALLDYKVHASFITSVYYAFARIVDGVGAGSPGADELTTFNRDWFARSLYELDAIVYVDAPDSQETQTITDNTQRPSNAPTQRSQRSERASQLTGSQSENTDKIIRLISSLGECVQYTPALISKQLFKLLQVIIPSDMLKMVHQKQQTAAPTPAARSQNTSFDTEMPISEYGGGGGGGNRPSAMLHMRVKQRTLRAELMTRAVRAHAVLTLGKLCLQDEQLAKKCIPVFIRELKENPDHFVRNNIIVVVCDLCIRYTSLVDRYSTILASSLKDRSILIRRQALLLLTNLVKEQYLKWEGALVCRYVTALLDPDNCIQEYAQFCLNDILLPHFKEYTFFLRFLECVFIFNGVMHESKKSIDGFEFSDEVDRLCSLEGREKFDARMHLYKYMLNTFEDHQKINISKKIGEEIFTPVIEGRYNLGDVKIRSLLFDSFKIMCTREIKLAMKLGERDVDYEGDDNDDPPELIQAAAKKVLVTAFRKGIVESVMPHLIAVRGFLMEKRSCLLAKECYAVILEICNEHKDQLEEFLASDPQLKAEIKFDLKRLHDERHAGGRRPATVATERSTSATQDLQELTLN